MTIIPAIDVRGGKVVRWITGSPDREIAYGDDPAAYAAEYEQAGAEWLHVVDLDGARKGMPCNVESILKIRRSCKLRMEVGGGLRTLEAIDTLLQCGIDRAIIGTKALEGNFLENALEKHRDKIAVGMDVMDGKVQVAGWAETTRTGIADFMEMLRTTSPECLIYTNIARDGMLTGPDVKGLSDICRAAPETKIVLSGGISSIEDIRTVCALGKENLFGIIVGRALYERKFSLKDALKIARETIK